LLIVSLIYLFKL